MATCELCGKKIALPYTCGYCGGTFCSSHRLPENHDCKGLLDVARRSRERGRIYRGISGDLEKGGRKPRERRSRPAAGISQALRFPLSLLKGFLLRNASIFILLTMFLVFLAQVVGQSVLGGVFTRYLAASQATVLARPWTLVTSIFAHGGALHLLVNGIVLFFFGPALERRIGRNRFVQLFLGAGILALVAQLLVAPPNVFILGASGAILGLLGTFTVLAPRTPVLLFFIIPMPLWLLTVGFGAFSAIMAFSGAGGPIAHMAHFSGLIVGLLYGYKLRRKRRYRHPLERLVNRYHW